MRNKWYTDGISEQIQRPVIFLFLPLTCLLEKKVLSHCGGRNVQSLCKRLHLLSSHGDTGDRPCVNALRPQDLEYVSQQGSW